MTGLIQYEEKHWLEYGADYIVTKITDQDIGGKLTLLIPIPPQAEQFVIRRVTPKTQEIDLHNGGRLTAELIETIGDKVTMLIQEIAEQILFKDDYKDIFQKVHTFIEAAGEAVRQAIIENDIKLAQAYQHLNEQFELYRSINEYLIWFIESKHGPLGGAFPLVIESGEYMITENDDFLVTA